MHFLFIYILLCIIIYIFFFEVWSQSILCNTLRISFSLVTSFSQLHFLHVLSYLRFQILLLLLPSFARWSRPKQAVRVQIDRYNCLLGYQLIGRLIMRHICTWYTGCRRDTSIGVPMLAGDQRLEGAAAVTDWETFNCSVGRLRVRA